MSAHSVHREEAFRAAACLAGADNQRLAARLGGLPPSIEALYADAEVRAAFPFADLLRQTLRQAAGRPQTPLYTDISLAIGRALHPLGGIEPEQELPRLRAAVARALRSEGLL